MKPGYSRHLQENRPTHVLGKLGSGWMGSGWSSDGLEKAMCTWGLKTGLELDFFLPLYRLVCFDSWESDWSSAAPDTYLYTTARVLGI